MFGKFSTRNVRKFSAQYVQKIFDPKRSKKSIQEDEKFSTQESRKNSIQEWRVMHIPSFFSSMLSSVQFSWCLIDCIPHGYYTYRQRSCNTNWMRNVVFYWIYSSCYAKLSYCTLMSDRSFGRSLLVEFDGCQLTTNI